MLDINYRVVGILGVIGRVLDINYRVVGILGVCWPYVGHKL